MLVTGYIGETSGIENNIMWGIISTIGYLYIVYEVFAGDVAKLAKNFNSPALGQAMFF
jgi:sensory rhodopsin